MSTGDFSTIAQQFVEFYYNAFDTNRAELYRLYRESSMLTFEAGAVKGAAAIHEKLTNLPFQKVKHEITTLDPQPTSVGVLVMVTGRLLVEEEERPMAYTQTFHLLPEAGTFYVYNDIFRLIYAAS